MWLLRALWVGSAVRNDSSRSARVNTQITLPLSRTTGRQPARKAWHYNCAAKDDQAYVVVKFGRIHANKAYCVALVVPAMLRRQRLTQDPCWQNASVSKLAHGALVTIIFASSVKTISASAVIVTRWGVARSLCGRGAPHTPNTAAPFAKHSIMPVACSTNRSTRALSALRFSSKGNFQRGNNAFASSASHSKRLRQQGVLSPRSAEQRCL